VDLKVYHSDKRKATVWCPSVRLSVCLFHLLPNQLKTEALETLWSVLQTVPSCLTSAVTRLVAGTFFDASLLLLRTIVVVILITVCNSFYIVCTIVLNRPSVVIFSYSALGCKSVLINQSIKQSPMSLPHTVQWVIPPR